MRACSAGKLSTMSDAVASGARNPAVCGAMRIGYLNRGARFFRVTDVLLAPYLEAVGSLEMGPVGSPASAPP